ncbi:MAG: hypothetical protein AABW49_00950 [Nanoarchaeota archaeon]
MISLSGLAIDYNPSRLLLGRGLKIIVFDHRVHSYTRGELDTRLNAYTDHKVEVQHINIADIVSAIYTGILRMVNNNFMVGNRNLTAMLLQEGSNPVGGTILTFDCLTPSVDSDINPNYFH